ncbi:hypothetical protein GCM10020218_090380 [Dactylosporangium vinaceum]
MPDRPTQIGQCSLPKLPRRRTLSSLGQEARNVLGEGNMFGLLRALLRTLRGTWRGRPLTNEQPTGCRRLVPDDI